MAAPRRQPPAPLQPQYIPVPTGNQSPTPTRLQAPTGSPLPTHHNQSIPPEQQQFLAPSTGSFNDGRGSSLGRRDTAHAVAKSDIGGGFGPYAHHQMVSQRDSGFTDTRRFSAAMSDVSSYIPDKNGNLAPTTATVPAYLWDAKEPEVDDALHNPDPVRDARLDRSFDPFSMRGWANASVLVILVVGLVTFFAGYPVIHFYTTRPPPFSGFNLGGVNASGQIPDIPGMRQLIDPDTPDNVKSRKGFDGKDYVMVFSDEFNQDGRTFWPGDDPFWEAVDLYYWPTLDLEWYSPQAITTKNGAMTITMNEVLNHRLNWQSGMLQSWNKFCFTTGYIEVSISLPGSGDVPGNWAAAWTMGNLGRPGYGATTEGMWPYTYDSCDVGTFPNQTRKDGTPTIAGTSGDPRPPAKGAISFLPGQRVSACTCPGSDHPGPVVSKGRGVPEIDIIEAQVDIPLRRGQASQSNQVAPFDAAYEFTNTTPGVIINDPTISKFNNYKGGTFQEAVSIVSLIDNENYNNRSFSTYGFEYWSNANHRDAGYITWQIGGTQSWQMNAGAVGPNPATEVDQRLVSEEPMSIIFNFGMSPGFQGADFKNLKFPQTMYVDYVRVYQRTDSINVGCSPPDYPTADYINNHINAYTNPNLTTWNQAGYSFPRNSLYDGC